jgi:sugar lactone lactonase YvrE
VEALFNGPSGVAVDGAGSVYVADSRNHCIRKITRGGVTTFAGGNTAGYADGPAPDARFASPAAVALAPDGSLLVADTGNHRIRRVTSDGEVSTYAGSETPKDDIGRFTGGERDGATGQAQFRYPVGLAADASGAVLVADAGNHSVRRITGGQVSTLRVSGGEMSSPTELTLVGERLWVSDTGGGLWTGPKEGPLTPWRLPAKQKGPKAPSGLAALGGAIYVADSGSHSIYRITEGNVSRVAGSGGPPAYADGRGAAASFSFPAAIAAAPGGGLYVADFGNNCIREVKLDASGEGR